MHCRRQCKMASDEKSDVFHQGKGHKNHKIACLFARTKPDRTVLEKC